MSARRKTAGSTRPKPAWTSELPFDESVAAQSRNTFRMFTKSLERRLASEGFTPGMFLYLRLMSDKSGLTQSEISEHLDIRGPTAIKVIDMLEKRELIYREKDLEDRRKTLIYLTPKGRKLRKKLMKYAIEVQNIALSNISEKEYEIYLKVINKMHHALKEDQIA